MVFDRRHGSGQEGLPQMPPQKDRIRVKRVDGSLVRGAAAVLWGVGLAR